MKVEDSGIPVPEHSRDLMFKAFNQGARGCGGEKKHGGSVCLIIMRRSSSYFKIGATNEPE